MNGYERALRTLRFEPTDCVPTWGGWIVSAGFFEYLTGRAQLGLPDRLRIVLYPTRPWVDLLELLLCDAYELARVFKNDCSGTGRSLVQSEDIVCHASVCLPSILC